MGRLEEIQARKCEGVRITPEEIQRKPGIEIRDVSPPPPGAPAADESEIRTNKAEGLNEIKSKQKYGERQWSKDEIGNKPQKKQKSEDKKTCYNC